MAWVKKVSWVPSSLEKGYSVPFVDEKMQRIEIKVFSFTVECEKNRGKDLYFCVRKVLWFICNFYVESVHIAFVNF